MSPEDGALIAKSLQKHALDGITFSENSEAFKTVELLRFNQGLHAARRVIDITLAKMAEDIITKMPPIVPADHPPLDVTSFRRGFHETINALTVGLYDLYANNITMRTVKDNQITNMKEAFLAGAHYGAKPVLPFTSALGKYIDEAKKKL